VNQLDLFGRTPLHLVNPGRRDDSIPKLLITRGADLVARDKIEQWAPLHAACRSEDTRLVRLLLEAENHLRPDNQTPQAGTSLTQRSPLFIASQYFRNNLLRLLLEHSKYRDDAETQCCFATPLDISILGTPNTLRIKSSLVCFND
jgi:ankyrin repeat protein